LYVLILIPSIALCSEKDVEAVDVVNPTTGCRLQYTKPWLRTITCPRKLSLSNLETRTPLLEKLKGISGEGATECGIIGLGDSKDSAFECARVSQSQERPFWVAFQREGIDSEIWTGAALSSQKERIIIHYDSNLQETGEISPHFSNWICSELKFDPIDTDVVVCGK
jgi:hypothetical protein